MSKGPEAEQGTLGWVLKQAAYRASKTASQIAAEMASAGTNTTEYSVRRWWHAGTQGPDGRMRHGPKGRGLAAYAVAVGCTVEELMGATPLPAGAKDSHVLMYIFNNAPPERKKAILCFAMGWAEEEADRD